MKRIEVVRHISADPASVALLLASPTGDAGTDGGQLHLADLDRLDVSALRRSGIGFAARVVVQRSDAAAVHGDIRVEPASDPGCEVRVLLRAPDAADAAAVQKLTGKFLSGLAERARSRSRAA